jgi:hypothetical protein
MFLAVFLMAATAARAQDWAREPVGEGGYIDWSEMKAYATGVGIAPPNTAEGQRRILANRAAIVVARRNLLEVVKGVRIDSETRVENFIVRSDAISSRVNGALEGADVQEGIYQRDGSCLVRVSVPLAGKLVEALFSAERGAAGVREGAKGLQERIEALEKRVAVLEMRVSSQKQISADQQRLIDLCLRMIAYLREMSDYGLQAVANQKGDGLGRLEKEQARLSSEIQALSSRLVRLEAQFAKTGPAPKAPAVQKAPHTGLVVDARGLGFRPCLKPAIYGKGKILYPRGDVDLNEAITGGYVRYYHNLGQAQISSTVGTLPYTAKAVGLYADKKGNLELEDKDTQYLESALEQEENFLKSCKVVIVF